MFRINQARNQQDARGNESELNYNRISKYVSITHDGCIFVNSAKYAKTGWNL
jgi:hypothetical protein